MPAAIAPKGKRIRIDLASMGLPEISCVGIYEMTHAERYAQAERHTDEMEIIYVKRGDFCYPVGGRTWRVRAGDVLVVRPGEWHGGVGHVLERCFHYWMKFKTSAFDTQFLGLDRAHSRQLVDALLHLPASHFHAAERLGERFEEIFSIIQSPGPLWRFAVASRIAAWLTMVVESAESPARFTISAEVQTAAKLIQQSRADWFDLTAFAGRCQISASQLRRNFRTELGVPVHEYQLESKVHVARALLDDSSRSITDIAFDLGFSSSQYFSTVFKRYTTQTPSEFRSRARENFDRQTIKNITPFQNSITGNAVNPS